jgi:hypothetical protein
LTGDGRLKLFEALAQAIVSLENFFTGMQEYPAFGGDGEVFFAAFD